MVLDTNGIANPLAGGSFTVTNTASGLYVAFILALPPQLKYLTSSNGIIYMQPTGLSAAKTNCILQTSTNLLAPVAWLNLLTNPAINGVSSFFTVTNGNNKQRFYRFIQP